MAAQHSSHQSKNVVFESGVHHGMHKSFLARFMEQESSGGIVLLLATVAALLCANWAWVDGYAPFWQQIARIQIGSLGAEMSLKHIVDDVLMALFFLVVGCELKRECVEGELSTAAQAKLPIIAALGGMIVPAVIFVGVNLFYPSLQEGQTYLNGWAIPTATDIAFALGVFAFLGNRVPASLKIFLMALAIIDDLGAVLIIGLFYASHFNAVALGFACVAVLGLFALNRKGVMHLGAYAFFGVFLWVALHLSGIHATLAGVITAAFLPLRELGTEVLGNPNRKSPLKHVEKKLHGWVAFGILPLFAFANAGVPLEGISAGSFAHPVSLGIIAGLFFGKQIGVFSATWLAVKAGWARLPQGTGFAHVYGMALLCGIGFTMSLFIAGLAFHDPALSVYTRLGVLSGSVLSALAGYAVLFKAGRS